MKTPSFLCAADMHTGKRASETRYHLCLPAQKNCRPQGQPSLPHGCNGPFPFRPTAYGSAGRLWDGIHRASALPCTNRKLSAAEGVATTSSHQRLCALHCTSGFWGCQAAKFAFLSGQFSKVCVSLDLYGVWKNCTFPVLQKAERFPLKLVFLLYYL